MSAVYCCQLNKSPEAVEFLKFLTVDFVWNSWSKFNNSAIQQFREYPEYFWKIAILGTDALLLVSYPILSPSHFLSAPSTLSWGKRI